MALDSFEAVLADPAALSIGAFAAGRLIGEVHCVRMRPRQFAHGLTDLTIAVDPEHQGRGVGAALFERLFDEARRLDPPGARIELITRSGNAGAIRLYERLGFVAEGRLVGRVRMPDGTVEDDIPMTRLL
jgi:putative acetyltransferase